MLSLLEHYVRVNGVSLIKAGLFYCTYGFEKSFCQPEIIVSGDESLAKNIVIVTKKHIENGGTIEHGNIFYMKEVDRLISLLEISAVTVFEHAPLLAELFHKETKFIQYIYSDRDGIFPWDVGIRALLNRRKQKVLGEVPWL